MPHKRRKIKQEPIDDAPPPIDNVRASINHLFDLAEQSAEVKAARQHRRYEAARPKTRANRSKGAQAAGSVLFRAYFIFVMSLTSVQPSQERLKRTRLAATQTSTNLLASAIVH